MQGSLTNEKRLQIDFLEAFPGSVPNPPVFAVSFHVAFLKTGGTRKKRVETGPCSKSSQKMGGG